jgi:hypothetical protein
VATIAVALLAAVLGRSAAWGHPDTLGTPDPYWQSIANPSSDATGRVAADGMAAGGATHPQLLRGYVYGAGALFVLLAASLVRSLWPSSRRSGSRPARG